VIPN